MDLVSHALVSLQDTKTYLGTTSLSDDQIKLYINVATDMIETATGRRFKQTTYTDQVFDGNGENEVLLPQYPVISFTSLGKNGAHNNSADWEVVGAEDYWRSDDEGRLIGVNRFYKGVGNYRATYVAGYASIPYDLQFAAMKLVKLLEDDERAAGLVSERLGDHSVTFEKGSASLEQDPMISKVISKYRRPNL
jgi:hypothetical protein